MELHDDSLLTVEQAAEFLGLSVKYLYTNHAAVRRNGIPCVKIGNGRKACVRFRVRDLRQFIEQHRVAA